MKMIATVDDVADAWKTAALIGTMMLAVWLNACQAVSDDLFGGRR